MGAWEFYAVVLLVYLGTNLLSVWGLNLQFGVSGVANLAYIVMGRLTTGPMGRSLRGVRDDEYAAAAVGKNVVGLRLMVQAVGGAFAGVSGALLAAFIGGWSPSAWVYVETLALLTAVIVGGMGSDRGVSVGTFLITILILQGVQFLPQIPSHPGLTEDIGWIVLGSLTIVFIFLRPQGVLPERRPTYQGADDPGIAEADLLS